MTSHTFGTASLRLSRNPSCVTSFFTSSAVKCWWMKSCTRLGMLLIVASFDTYSTSRSFTRSPSSMMGGTMSMKAPVSKAPTTTNVARMPTMRYFMWHLYWKNLTIGKSR